MDSINLDGYYDVAKRIGVNSENNEGFILNRRSIQDFATFYRGDGLTKRFINLLSDDMVREWFTIPEDPSGELLKRIKRLKAKKHIEKALKSAKLFGGSIIFMAIDDGGKPNQKVNINNINKITSLKVFSRKNIQLDTTQICTDPNSEYFGDYEYFNIIFNNLNEAVGETTIHRSRCLIFEGEYCPEESPDSSISDHFWGTSTLESLHKLFKSYGLALEALLEVFVKFNIDVLKIKNLMALLSSKNGEKMLEERVNILERNSSVNRKVVLDSEESFEVVAQNLTGVADTFTKIQETVTAMTGVPSNILMGVSLKGLNVSGDGEMRIYYDKIRSHQTKEIVPELEYLVTLLSHCKDLNIKESYDYTVVPNSLWQQSEEEKVKIRKEQSETDRVYLEKGVVTPEEVRDSRFGNKNYSIDTEIKESYKPKITKDNEKEKKN